MVRKGGDSSRAKAGAGRPPTLRETAGLETSLLAGRRLLAERQVHLGARGEHLARFGALLQHLAGLARLALAARDLADLAIGAAQSPLGDLELLALQLGDDAAFVEEAIAFGRGAGAG